MNSEKLIVAALSIATSSPSLFYTRHYSLLTNHINYPSFYFPFSEPTLVERQADIQAESVLFDKIIC